MKSESSPDRRCSLTALMRCQRGNIVMLAALMIPVVISLAGMAIDLQFTVRQKEKVQHALDSAILAGALSRQNGADEETVTADVRAYTNALIGNQGGELSCQPVRVQFFESSQDIEGYIACEQPTFLSSLMGIDELKFHVESTSTYGVGKIDVAFVFDVSGSMNSENRLADLKVAASNAFDELLPDDYAQDGTVRLSIATYNNSVNAGAYFDAATRSVTLNADSSNSEAKTRYTSYNDARMIDQSSSKRFFYYERGTCTSSKCGSSGTYTWNVRRRFFNDVAIGKTCVHERIGTQAASDAAPGAGAHVIAGNPRWNFNASSSSKYHGWQEVENGGADSSSGAYDVSWAQCRPSGPVPLTEDKVALKAHVDALTAGGGTAGHLGIAWGWYLISPNWASVWPSVSEPRAYDEAGVTKVLILMTDGNFNSQHPTAGSTSFEQSQALCDAMKAAPANVQVYTVGFKTPTDVTKTSDGRTILQYCATSPAHAFDATSGEELVEVYRTIAQSISDLRLKK